MNLYEKDVLLVKRTTLLDKLHPATNQLKAAQKMADMGILPKDHERIAALTQECEYLTAELADVEKHLQE
jgi:hypothetical protein